MQAKTGGEYGLNGEWYKGGQFLPSSETTIKGMQNQASITAKPRKQEVAPYLWVVSEKQAIWPSISNLVKFVGKTTYSKETGKVGQVEVVSFNHKAMGWSDEGLREFEQLVERWNQGERWL